MEFGHAGALSNFNTGFIGWERGAALMGSCIMGGWRAGGLSEGLGGCFCFDGYPYRWDGLVEVMCRQFRLHIIT